MGDLLNLFGFNPCSYQEWNSKNQEVNAQTIVMQQYALAGMQAPQNLIDSLADKMLNVAVPYPHTHKRTHDPYKIYRASEKRLNWRLLKYVVD